mmetsp:Transcript_37767/g.100300  ORF Transcript_37767/g.100300 Transcript_37767/m.100300 type:complete len:177 (+) Transcript_37767:259-789(+)
MGTRTTVLGTRCEDGVDAFDVLEIAQLRRPPCLPSSIPSDVADFLQCCLVPEPAARTRAHHLARHHFLSPGASDGAATVTRASSGGGSGGNDADGNRRRGEECDEGGADSASSASAARRDDGSQSPIRKQDRRPSLGMTGLPVKAGLGQSAPHQSTMQRDFEAYEAAGWPACAFIR